MVIDDGSTEAAQSGRSPTTPPEFVEQNSPGVVKQRRSTVAPGPAIRYASTKDSEAVDRDNGPRATPGSATAAAMAAA